MTIDDVLPCFLSSTKEGCLTFWPILSYHGQNFSHEASTESVNQLECMDRIGSNVVEDLILIRRLRIFFQGLAQEPCDAPMFLGELPNGFSQRGVSVDAESSDRSDELSLGQECLSEQEGVGEDFTAAAVQRQQNA